MHNRSLSAGARRLILTSAATVLGCGMALAAFAQNTPPPPPGDMPPPHMRPTFADLDTNKDGVISQSEFDAFKPKQGPEHGPHDRMPPGGPEHVDLDANKDGKITLDEFLAPAKAHFARLDTNHDGALDASERPKGPPPGDGPPPPPPAK